MEILLLVTVIVVGASGLYVAATFNRRTQLSTAPLIDDALKKISDIISKSYEDSALRIQNIDAELTRHGELVRENSEARTRLGGNIARISDVISHYEVELEAIKGLAERTSARQEELDRRLEQLYDQLRTIGQSLSQQEAGIRQIGDLAENGKSLAGEIGSIRELLHAIDTRQSRAGTELSAIADRIGQHLESDNQREHYGRRAAGRLLDSVERIEVILRGQTDIRYYLRSLLEYEVARTNEDDMCRLIAASLRLSGSGADILWPLLLTFCEAIALKALVPTPRHSPDHVPYLLWRSHDGQRLDDVLSAKLEACFDNSSLSPGVDELRSLFLALHVAGPGTIWLGPMVINRTQTTLLACVIPASGTALMGAADVVTSPDACERELRQLAYGRIADMTAWADAFVR